MNLFQIQKLFNTKAKCIRHLELVRWGGEPVCPHCESINVTPRKSRKFFYHCNKCNRDFTVMFGTIFESSKMPLPKWFMLIGIMLNARKGVSSMELHRHLGVTYKTAWYSAMRVRCAMIDEAPLLEGIVEMDEMYVGGKPRKRNLPDNVADLSRVKTKRGRGTKQVPVVGIVEREGQKRVVTEVAERLTTKNMLELLRKYVNEEKAIMMTDDARFYHQFENEIQHLVINHSKKKYVDGIIHTNTIEGFWSIVKNGIRGEYYVLSKKYLPFYLAEFAYKYNRRSDKKKATAFEETIESAVADDKCLVDYKPKGSVERIVYSKKAGKKDAEEREHQRPSVLKKAASAKNIKRKVSKKDLEKARKKIKKRIAEKKKLRKRNVKSKHKKVVAKKKVSKKVTKPKKSTHKKVVVKKIKHGKVEAKVVKKKTKSLSHTKSKRKIKKR